MTKTSCCKPSSWDLDQILSYSTFKIIVIRDRYLGLLHYTFYVAIFAYILFKVFSEQAYYKTAPPVGVVRMNLRAPTDPPLCETGLTNTALVCKSYNSFHPPEELPYCLKGTECAYLNESEIVYPDTLNNNFALSTRITVSNETRNCSVLGNPSCAFVPTGKKTNFFVGDIESYSLRMVHRVVAPEIGVQNTDYTFHGNWQRSACSFSTCQPTACTKYVSEFNETYTYNTTQSTIMEIGKILEYANLDIDSISITANKTFRSQGITILLIIEYRGDARHVNFVVRPMVMCTSDYKIVQSIPAFSPLSDANAMKTSYDRHGIRFVVLQTGVLRTVSIMNLLVNLTVSIGLLKLAQLIVDLLAMYVMPDRQLYKNSKYQYTEDFSDIRKRSRTVSETMHLTADASSPHHGVSTSQKDYSSFEPNPHI